MSKKNCSYFNKMYMQTKCSVCGEYFGVTCFNCGRCIRCHKPKGLSKILSYVMVIAIIVTAYFLSTFRWGL